MAFFSKVSSAKKMAGVVPLRERTGSPSSVLSPQEKEIASHVHKSVTVKKPVNFGLKLISRNDRIFFIDNLAAMLTAGLPLSMALQTLAGETKNKVMRNALRSIQHHVNNGDPFSDSLANHPELFSPLFVAVIQVGEATGSLAEVLTRLAERAKKEKALRSKILNAMLYPSIVVAAMIGIVIVLMIYVFPQLIAIFEEVQVDLPLQTKILIGIVTVLREYGLYCAAVGIIIIALLMFGKRVKKIRRVYHKIFLSVPLAGNIAKEVALTRILGNLKMLLTSGVPIVQSIRIAAQTAGNVVYEEALYELGKNLEVGTSVHEALAKKPKLFPSLAVTMTSVGEETGKLDEVIGKLEIFYENRVDNIFANLSTIIEPVLLLTVGVMVGFIAISVIMPIYDLAQAF